MGETLKILKIACDSYKDSIKILKFIIFWDSQKKTEKWNKLYSLYIHIFKIITIETSIIIQLFNSIIFSSIFHLRYVFIQFKH